MPDILLYRDLRLVFIGITATLSRIQKSANWNAFCVSAIMAECALDQ